MKIQKISKQKLKKIIKENKNTSRYWKNKEISGLYVIKEDNKPIGLLSSRNKKDSYFINMIEIFDKNKGYGQKAIEEIKKMTPKDIKGIPVTEAEPFWLKVGAQFDKSIYFTIKKQKEN